MEQTSIYLQGRKLVPSRVAKRVNEKSPASSNVINARYRAANSDALLKSLHFCCVYLKTGRTNKIPPENFPYFCSDFFAKKRKKAARLPEWRSLTACFVWKSCQNRLTAVVTVTEKACVQQAPKRHILTIQQ